MNFISKAKQFLCDFRGKKNFEFIPTDSLDADQWAKRIREITPKSLHDHLHGSGKGPGFWTSAEKRPAPARSLQRAGKLFDRMKGKIIVEIGSGLQGHGAGNSALVWYKNTAAIKIFCVDPDPRALQSVRKQIPDTRRLICAEQDGAGFIEAFQDSIDLLYLDFWQNSARERANAYLHLYEKASKKMSPASLLLIDDTDHADPWKQTWIVPAACRDGFRVMWCGRQTLLLRK